MIRDLARRLARRGSVHARTIAVGLTLAAAARADALDATGLLRARKATTSRTYCRAQESWGSIDSTQAPGSTICVAPPPARPSASTTEMLPAERPLLGVTLAHSRPADVMAPPRTDTRAPNDWRRLMGWIASGIGVAGIGIGAGAGFAGQPRKSTADRKCENISRCTDGHYVVAGGGGSLRVVSVAGWVTGALGTGTGLYLLLGGRRETGEHTRITADFFGGGAGVRVSRTF